MLLRVTLGSLCLWTLGCVDSGSQPDSQSLSSDMGVPQDIASSFDHAASADMVALNDAQSPRDIGPSTADITSMDARLIDALVDVRLPVPLDLGVDATGDTHLADVDVVLDAAAQEPRESRCNDQADDDGDDRIDCEDPDCRGAPVCFDLREICDDGIDNNGDDRTDCDDVTCHLEPGCPPPDVEAFTTEQVEARFVIDCVPCHGPPQPEVQLDLTPPFLDRILNVPSFEVELPYIKSGDAAQSWIYHKIRYRQLDFMGDGDGMPPEHTWTSADAQRLGLWIDDLETQ